MVEAEITAVGAEDTAAAGVSSAADVTVDSCASLDVADVIDIRGNSAEGDMLISLASVHHQKWLVDSVKQRL